MQQLALNQNAPPPPSSHHTVRASKLAVGSGLSIMVVDATFRSRLFWAYAIVVDRIGEVLQEAAAWAESCDCHFSEPTLIGPTRHSRHSRRKLFRDRSEFQDICPLSGKRAFCCAAGDLVRLFHTLAETAHSQLLSEPFFGGIEEADSSVLFRDFAAGRTYIIAMSEIKFGHWRQLPWVLFGISHPNHMIAVECARRSLQLAAGFEDRTNGHLLNRQMKVFAQGQTNMLDLDVEDMNQQEKTAIATAPVQEELAISTADDDKTDDDKTDIDDNGPRGGRRQDGPRRHYRAEERRRDGRLHYSNTG